MKVRASNEGDFKRDLDEIGNESGDNEMADYLEKIWIGSGKKPTNTRVAMNVTEKLTDPDAEDAPYAAVNPEYPDLGLDKDKEEEKFFVDQSSDGEDNPQLKKLKDIRMNLNYPAGNTPTANSKGGGQSKTASPEQLKAAAHEKLEKAKARLANAKNLASLMAAKGMVQREDLPELAKTLASMDNQGFMVLRKAVDFVKASASQGRQAKASATEAGMLSEPIHTAKPSPRGQSLIDSLSAIPWEGVPSADYDHTKYANGH